MGGNESKKESHVKVENETFVVNKTDIEMLNETNQRTSNDAIVEVVQSSSTNTVAKNKLTLKGVKIKTSKSFKIDMTNNSSVQITTAFMNKVITRIQSDLSADMTSKIENNVSNDMLSKLMNHLDEKTKNGWGDLGDLSEKLGIMDNTSESDSKEIINKINMSNDLHTKLQNVVNLVVNSTINTKISNQCINNMISEIETTIEDSEIDVGEDFSLNQNNTIKLVITCTATNEIISEISDKLTQLFDIEIKDDKQNKTTTDTTSDMTKETENQGIGGAVGEGAKGIGEGASEVIDSAGEAGSKVVKSAGEAASSVFSGMTWIFVIVGFVLVAAIVGIVIFLNSGAGQEISKKVADKGLSKIGGCSSCSSNNTFLKQLISGGK